MHSLLPLEGLVSDEIALAWIDKDGFVHKFNEEENLLSPFPFPNSLLLTDGSRRMLESYNPYNPTDIATKAYVDASAGGGGGGDFYADGHVPMTGDLEMGGHILDGVSNLLMSDGSTFNGNTWLPLSGSSHMSVAADANFGIYNGEIAGVGADINLVSDNGAIMVQAGGGITTFANNDATQNWTRFQGANTIFNGFLVGAGAFNEGIILYSHNTTPPYFSIVCGGDGVGQGFNVLSGGIVTSGLLADDGTGAPFQSIGDVSVDGAASFGGSYWAQGQQGITDTVPAGAGFTVVGGLVVGHE
jgi:hypothetical protein